jgi:hypothetical protein
MAVDKRALDEEQDGLMLFNRAVEYNDPVAWQCLHERYSGIMCYWLGQWVSHNEKYCLESKENYIALAFERFWYAASYKRRVRFETLAGALDYLRASLRSVAIDVLRTRRREDVLSVQQDDWARVSVEEDEEETYELWEEITKILPDERELRIAHLIFRCNLKPRQIVQLFPREFDNVQELYRVRKKIFDRFVHNATLLRWRLQG